MKINQATIGFKESHDYMANLKKEQEIEGFTSLSSYVKDLIESQRHFRKLSNDFFQKNKGTTKRIYNYSGDLVSITINSEKDLIDYLTRVHEGYRFFFDRLLFRPDLSRELMKVDPAELERFLAERSAKKITEKTDEKVENAATSEIQP